MKISRLGIFIILCFCVLLPLQAATAAWETVGGITATAQTEDTDRIDVSVSDGYIYVTTTRSTTVKVMSIVGQLISQQTLPAGTSRLKVSARGIYILKIGHLTRRVTV